MNRHDARIVEPDVMTASIHNLSTMPQTRERVLRRALALRVRYAA
jgi:hypothetical protein